MLVLGTLIVTWIAHNWWKLALLLVTVIVIHEYWLHKNKKPGEKENTGTETEDTGTGKAGPDDADQDTEYIEYE